MRALLHCALAGFLVFIPVAVGFAKDPSTKKVSEMSEAEVRGASVSRGTSWAS